MVIAKEASNAHMPMVRLSFANVTLHSRLNFVIALLEEAAKSPENNVNTPTANLIFALITIIARVTKEKSILTIKIEDTFIVH